MNILPFYICTKCNAPQEFRNKDIIDSFHGVEFQCETCKQRMSLFENIRDQIELNFMSNSIFTFIEAKSKIIEFSVEENSIFVFDFTKYGLPSTAKLLYINYSPNGHLAPVEIHGSEVLKFNDSLTRNLIIIRYGDGLPVIPSTVNCFVTWTDKNSPDFDGLTNLVDAFESYKHKKYDEIIISANVSVELPLDRLIQKKMTGICPKDKLENFLNNAATYSHQLNVLFPYIGSKDGFYDFNDHVRGQLNKLRKLRNEIAHNGKPEKEISTKEAASLLTASLFGNRYLNYLLQH